MVKVIIDQAYHRIPVHPDYRGLLGMRFEGVTYVDTVLPFGLRSAPKVFNAVADALEWWCRSKGVISSTTLTISLPFVFLIRWSALATWRHCAQSSTIWGFPLQSIKQLAHPHRSCSLASNWIRVASS